MHYAGLQTNISRISTVGPKVGMLVHARTSHVSTVTSRGLIGPRSFLWANDQGFLARRIPWAKAGQLELDEWL